jgi:hypothetical protein
MTTQKNFNLDELHAYYYDLSSQYAVKYAPYLSRVSNTDNDLKEGYIYKKEDSNGNYHYYAYLCGRHIPVPWSIYDRYQSIMRGRPRYSKPMVKHFIHKLYSQHGVLQEDTDSVSIDQAV